MFIKNKYTNWYYKIIEKAKEIERDVYTEKHHIIPKSLGGNNKKENIVKLTAREHFVCHWLLTKMVEGTKHQYQMHNAFSCMLYRENKNQERYKVSSKIFENIKKQNSLAKSKRWSGENNPMYQKQHSLLTKEKMSKTRKGKVFSQEHKESMSRARLGKPKTDQHKESLKKSWSLNREKRSGEYSPWFNKSHSEESKEKIRQKIFELAKRKSKCVHCGKETSLAAITRWHNDNCKFK